MDKKIMVTSPAMPPIEEYFEEIKSIWENRWLTHTGPKHVQLQQSLEQYLGVKNVELFANGHLALEILIQAIGLTGEIITTPFTFASTTQAILRNNITPVFCDIEDEFYTMDANKIEALITEKTSAIIPVHVYGNVCNVEKIQKIADKYGLKVIYDAAHVFGTKINGKGIGSFGDASMFSFHATKVFNTIEGGCCTFSDETLVNKLKSIRQFGQSGELDVPFVGTNAKMTEFSAAMGICNLRYIKENILSRKRCVIRYRERLTGVKGIKLCREQTGIESNYAYFPVVFDGYKYNRDEVCEELAKYNVFSRKYFYPLTSSFECITSSKGETPVAKRISEKVLTLPLYADLSIEDVDRICNIILK